jgi:HAD superfamily hydrolase (TIGR01490 family)
VNENAVPDRYPGTVGAFFDLDKTIIAKAAMSVFWGPLYDEGLLTRRAVVRALFAQAVYLHLGAGDLRLVRIRRVLSRLARGWDARAVREIVAETLEHIVDPIIYSEAVDLIELHQALGHRVVIVSASPEEIVEPLARHLGVTSTIASRADLDEEGRYTGELAFYAYGPFKAEAVDDLAHREGIDLAGSYAYSDSVTDAPMLEMVGHPVAVNPDRSLRSLANARGWEIRTFTRPVRMRTRLRDRFPERQPVVVASAGALTAVVAAIAIGWRVALRRATVTTSRDRALLALQPSRRNDSTADEQSDDE